MKIQKTWHDLCTSAQEKRNSQEKQSEGMIEAGEQEQRPSAEEKTRAQEMQIEDPIGSCKEILHSLPEAELKSFHERLDAWEGILEGFFEERDNIVKRQGFLMTRSTQDVLGCSGTLFQSRESLSDHLNMKSIKELNRMTRGLGDATTSIRSNSIKVKVTRLIELAFRLGVDQFCINSMDKFGRVQESEASLAPAGHEKGEESSEGIGVPSSKDLAEKPFKKP